MMMARICDCCGELIRDNQKLVHTSIAFRVRHPKLEWYDWKESTGSFDFHEVCFCQCFNTFVDKESKCFTDLDEDDEIAEEGVAT